MIYPNKSPLSECPALSSTPQVLIIESVDPICKDSADTQYMIQKTPNLKDGKLIISFYNDIPSECSHDQQVSQ